MTARRDPVYHSGMLTGLETGLIAGLLIVLMFGMGATLTFQHFVELARSPRAFLIGTASQFGWMPLLAFLLAKGLSLPNAAALGLIVMGTCPGGATSNLFAHLARADVALSISMTAASKLLGIVLMPLCLFIYARPFTGSQFPIPYGNIVGTLIPISAASIAMPHKLPSFSATRPKRSPKRLRSSIASTTGTSSTISVLTMSP